MKDLKDALILRREYNRMAFDKFAEMIYEYIYDELSEDEKEQFEREKEQFEFSGLLNIDFFTQWVKL